MTPDYHGFVMDGSTPLSLTVEMLRGASARVTVYGPEGGVIAEASTFDNTAFATLEQGELNGVGVPLMVLSSSDVLPAGAYLLEVTDGYLNTELEITFQGEETLLDTEFETLSD